MYGTHSCKRTHDTHLEDRKGQATALDRHVEGYAHSDVQAQEHQPRFDAHVTQSLRETKERKSGQRKRKLFAGSLRLAQPAPARQCRPRCACEYKDSANRLCNDSTIGPFFSFQTDFANGPRHTGWPKEKGLKNLTTYY
eukprot:1142473-Pelagomonas_calceolata.AAC.13